MYTQAKVGSPTSLGANTGALLQTRRFEAIRNQLVSQGIPRRNIIRGRTFYDQNPSRMNGQVNQVIFRINTINRRNVQTNKSTTQ